MKLILEDGTILKGESFGASCEAFGEVVFNTGMVGYPETLTDPSYRGEILVLTYPLIGNYGVVASNLKLKSQKSKIQSKNKKLPDPPFESDKIQIAGLVVSEYCEKYSHPSAVQSLGQWLKSENIPALQGIDTRALTQKLREKGTMLGKISNIKYLAAMLRMRKQAGQISKKIFEDPNKRNLAAEVSCRKPIIYEPKKLKTKNYKLQTILLYDCGVKYNIIRSLLNKNCCVIRVPWNYKIDQINNIDGILISNGPGDPTKCGKIIEQIKAIIQQSGNRTIPILGICLGNQILALAAGAKTYKLKYGHRSQNQPVIDKNHKAYITSQNHGYSVKAKSLPKDWRVWFTNLNDNTIEGIKHKNKPWMSVQFHPEATPGPTDTAWIFDKWISLL